MRATAAFLLASVLAAIAAPPSEARDIIGIYADPAGTIEEIFVGPYETFDLHLLLKDPSSSSDIIAWDCLIAYPDAASGGNVVVTSWKIAGGGTNMATEPEFQTAMLRVPPLASDDVVLFLSIEAYLTTPEEAPFYVRGSTLDPLGTGRPTYRPDDWGEEPGSYVAMSQSSGDPGTPVFTINSQGPSPVSPGTWSRVKALYR